MDSIASALVTSKIKGVTKDLENAVGLNEDESRSNEVGYVTGVGYIMYWLGPQLGSCLYYAMANHKYILHAIISCVLALIIDQYTLINNQHCY